MLDILETFRSALTADGNDNVYLAFDALPVRGKGGTFTVIGIKSYEASAPVYSETVAFVPFRAEVEVSVYAPESGSMQSLYSYFEDHVLPVIEGMMNLSTRLSRLAIRHDSNLKRLVITAGVSVSGIRRIERGSE